MLPGPDGHRLRLTLAARDADPLQAARLTDRKQNREHPIVELRLDIVGIDRPGESDRPLKRAGDDFPREPVVSLSMTASLALLGLLRLLSSALPQTSTGAICDGKFAIARGCTKLCSNN